MKRPTYYQGIRRCGRAVIMAGGVRELDIKPSLAIVNHSPTGFEWGYSGSGPAQSALGILLDYTGNQRFSERYHQYFKDHFISKQNKLGWTLPSEEIEAFLVMIVAQELATKRPLCGCLHYEREHFDDELVKGCTYCDCKYIFKIK